MSNYYLCDTCRWEDWNDTVHFYCDDCEEEGTVYKKKVISDDQTQHEVCPHWKPKEEK